MVDHEHMKDRAAKLQGNKMRVEPKQSKKSFFDSLSSPIFPPFYPHLHNFTTVKPLLRGHLLDLPKCLLNRGCPLNKGCKNCTCC